jgi:TfoX/Sxy family transcriptional regulator of competence genes
MTYDENLAERIRACLDGVAGIEEKKMFGGLAFLLDGNMSVGVIKDELMVRVGKDDHEEFAQLPGARIMDFTRRQMKGWLVVGGVGIADDGDLASWVYRGTDFASTLPKR